MGRRTAHALTFSLGNLIFYIVEKYTKEDIENFLHGTDPMERIIKIELDDDYNSDEVTIFYRDENGKKLSVKDDFHPFLWSKRDAAQRLFGGNRPLLRAKLNEYGISCKDTRTKKEDGTEPERMKNGYRILFYANRKMSYTQFLKFFEEGDVPVYPKQGHKEKGNKNYVCVRPNEQYMIYTGKRLFKGFNDYDELVRVQWDLETTGLNGKEDVIEQIGIRSNKGFEQILTIEGEGDAKLKSQYGAMENFFSALKEIDPDVVSGYNSENFDWVFMEDQYEKYGTNITRESSKYLRKGVYKKKKEAILKLGGEMERYRPTVMYSTNITDGLHAVRRAMALDSNIKSATLKNIAKDFKLNPKNRVYVPGNSISDVWNDLEKNYAFNDEDGDWYRYDPSYVKPKVELKQPKFKPEDYDLFIEEDKAAMERYQKFLQTFDSEIPEKCQYSDEFFNFETGEIFEYKRKYDDTDTGQSVYDREVKRLLDEYNEANTFKKGYDGKKFTLYTRNYIAEDYVLVTGRYVVERYLMDDLRETDAVELQFNQSNFLISKMLPLSFERACTMGTAGIWKYIMLAFSYENGLAIPEAETAVLSIGGLSRLERTGLCTGVAKLDYNSLYPSICLSFDYKCDVDVADAMHTMLEFVLTQREHFKEEKKKYGKAADKIKVEKEEYINSLKENEFYKNVDDKEFAKQIKKDKKIVELTDKYNEQKKLSSKYDKLQLPYKILGNSWFGSVSSNVFYWNSAKVGGLITSTGRMMFRLLTHHFMTMSERQPVYVKNGECQPLEMGDEYNYQPIVGDSVTGDTPLLVKNKDGYIDIIPIEELINENNVRKDELGREYDMCEKVDYEVLCRSGWMKPNYIYRHKTDKPIYRIEDGNMLVECTEDHSLFNSKQEKIKPTEITDKTELEYYNGDVERRLFTDEIIDVIQQVNLTLSNPTRIPQAILNAPYHIRQEFRYMFIETARQQGKHIEQLPKTLRAGLQILKK